MWRGGEVVGQGARGVDKAVGSAHLGPWAGQPPRRTFSPRMLRMLSVMEFSDTTPPTAPAAGSRTRGGAGRVGLEGWCPGGLGHRARSGSHMRAPAPAAALTGQQRSVDHVVAGADQHQLVGAVGCTGVEEGGGELPSTRRDRAQSLPGSAAMPAPAVRLLGRPAALPHAPRRPQHPLTPKGLGVDILDEGDGAPAAAQHHHARAAAHRGGGGALGAARARVCRRVDEGRRRALRSSEMGEEGQGA